MGAKAGRNAKGICHQRREENYETSRAINRRKENFIFSIASDAENERRESQAAAAPGDHFKLSIPIDQQQITFSMDHLMPLLL